jgi:hypothetical protein
VRLVSLVGKTVPLRMRAPVSAGIAAEDPGSGEAPQSLCPPQ